MQSCQRVQSSGVMRRMASGPTREMIFAGGSANSAQLSGEIFQAWRAQRTAGSSSRHWDRGGRLGDSCSPRDPSGYCRRRGRSRLRQPGSRCPGRSHRATSVPHRLLSAFAGGRTETHTWRGQGIPLGSSRGAATPDTASARSSAPSSRHSLHAGRFVDWTSFLRQPPSCRTATSAHRHAGAVRGHLAAQRLRKSDQRISGGRKALLVNMAGVVCVWCSRTVRERAMIPEVPRSGVGRVS